MNFALPTFLHFSVVQVAATLSIHGEDGSPRSSESFSLVLRATGDANIVLSTGQHLSDVDVHLTLSTKWRTASEIDRDLTKEDVGFLSHIEGELGEPFVHGGAILSTSTVIGTLLSVGTNGTVKLVLPSVPITDKNDAPFVWGQNRPNILRISHLEVSVLRLDGTQRDG